MSEFALPKMSAKRGSTGQRGAGTVASCGSNISQMFERFAPPPDEDDEEPGTPSEDAERARLVPVYSLRYERLVAQGLAPSPAMEDRWCDQPITEEIEWLTNPETTIFDSAPDAPERLAA